MQGDKNVIYALNQVLGQSLIAINQYFLHARIAKNWGLNELNEVFYKQSIREMKWSDNLIERILLLEGLPNLQEYGKILIGETVNEMLDCDNRLESIKYDIITNAIKVCEDAQDYVSRKMLLDTKDGNEEYIDWLDTQVDLIAAIGEQNYVQSMATDD